MKKITLKTKISLIIVTLMAAAGFFYAATTPTLFTSVPLPTGVAASQTKLYVTEYCNPKIDIISNTGAVTSFATLPGNSGECKERYMAIAPSNAAKAGFNPAEIFVTDGDVVYKVSPDGLNVTTFATLTGCGYDHSGITFDHVGPFGFNMIVTCPSGDIWRLDGTGAPNLIANLGLGDGEYEGPAVVPLDSSPLAGQILVSNESNDAVHAIAADGTLSLFVFSLFGAEGVLIVPSTPCGFANTGITLLSGLQQQNQVNKLSTTDFTGSGLGGDILILSEEGAGIRREHWNGSSYDQFDFDTTSLPYEGSAFIDCDVPPPSPTPTPTATPTATPTPTPTPTATPVASPTPCTLLPCTPPYPFVSNNTQTNVAFNESTVMKGFRISTSSDGCSPQAIQVFYSDEHALTLGVRQVSVKTSSKVTTITNYAVAKLATAPGSATNPDVGATAAQGGSDTAGRPMFPALFITDLSVGPGTTNALAGDWQYGGTGVPPTAVFGTWKGAVKTIDQTKNPATTTVTPDADPKKNNWSLGVGADPVPAGLANEGYGAEVRWNVNTLGLISGHQYRLYFMVHDGDQNKTGGDVGQACGFFTMP
jgi:hypothetical protein